MTDRDRPVRERAGASAPQGRTWVKLTITTCGGGFAAGAVLVKDCKSEPFEVDTRLLSDERARVICALVAESGLYRLKGQLLSSPTPSHQFTVMTPEGSNTCRFREGSVPAQLLNLKLHIQQVIGGN